MALDQAKTSEEAPPQASFMGLPAELRVRIYEHLDSTTAIEPTKTHCCFDAGASENEPLREHLCCACTPTVHPALLATCRFIFNEALPTVYSSFTSRLVLPSLHPEFPDGSMTSINRHSPALNKIPSYGMVFITDVLLVGAANDTAMKVNEGDLSETDWEVLDVACADIARALPNINTIRLHFDLNFSIDLDYFDMNQFNGLVRFEKLLAVQLELWTCDGNLENDMEYINLVRYRVALNLGNHLASFGDECGIETSVSVPIGHSNACLCCSGEPRSDSEESEEA